MTGENDPICFLHFAVGKKSDGPYGGRVEFDIYQAQPNKLTVRSFQLFTYDEMLHRREKVLGSELAAQVERCKLLLRALKTLFPDWTMHHTPRHVEADKDSFDEMLTEEGVKLNFRLAENIAAYEAKRPHPYRTTDTTVLKKSGWEQCALYSHDYFLNITQKAISIESQNVFNYCDRALKECLENADKLINFCNTLPFFFRFTSERNYKKLVVPFRKLQPESYCKEAIRYGF